MEGAKKESRGLDFFLSNKKHHIFSLSVCLSAVERGGLSPPIQLQGHSSLSGTLADTELSAEACVDLSDWMELERRVTECLRQRLPRAAGVKPLINTLTATSGGVGLVSAL